MAIVPVAGTTHDITLASGATKYGFMIAPGSYRTERVDDFAPRIATGTDSKTREGFWDSYSQEDAVDGVDQAEFASASRINQSDGNVFTDLPQAIQLDSIWTELDANKVCTAPMIVDFTVTSSAATMAVAAVGTKIRRTSAAPYTTWTDSTTTLSSNCVWLHEHSYSGTNYMFAAVSTGADFYRSTDGDTFSQPCAGQKANCFTTWQKSDGTVYLALGLAATIRLSTDGGATFAAAINVGNPSSIVTGLSSAFGYLLIGKEDGLFRYDGTNMVDIVQYPTQKNSNNFKSIVNFDGFLYTHMMGRVLKIALTSGAVSSLVDITPEMAGSVDKDLYGHGRPVWLFVGPFVLYTAFTGGQNMFPELMAYSGSGWHQRFVGRKTTLAAAITDVQTSVTISTANLVPASCTVLVGSEKMTVSAVDATGLILTVTRGATSTTAAAAASGATLTVLGTMSAAGYSQNLTRMLINPGTILARQQITLRDAPFESYDTTGVFQTSDFTGDLPFMQKAFRSINVEARNLSVPQAGSGSDDNAGRKITVEYSTDKGITFITMGTVTTDGRTNIPFKPTTTTTLSDSATVNSNSMRLRFTLTRGSVATKSPVLIRYSVDFLNRPLATHAHSLNLRLGTTMTLRDGTLETITVGERQQFIKDIEDSESPIRFIDMTGRHYLVYVTKTSVVKVEKEVEDERMVAIVMVDAITGLWPQVTTNVSATVTVTVTAYDAAVYDTDVFETGRFG